MISGFIWQYSTSDTDFQGITQDKEVEQGVPLLVKGLLPDGSSIEDVL